MKIEKHGKFYKKTYNFPIRFTCKLCGCQFVAGSSEYEDEWDPVPPFMLNENSRHAKRIGYSIECPECGFDIMVGINEAEFVKLKD